MDVKNILKTVAVILQMNDILEILNSDQNLQELENEELKLLLSCVNLVNNLIATDYIKLTKTALCESSNGYISFQNITDSTILNIISVKDEYGNKLMYKICEGGIKTFKNKVFVRFAYFPKEVSILDKITDYKTKMTERVFAYGVAGEYLFIKGNVDDASMWDVRFKQSLRNLVRSIGDTSLPKRRWL